MEHRPHEFHPESPSRLKMLYEMLEEPEVAGRFEPIPPRPAQEEDLKRIHDPQYIEMIASTAGRPRVSLDPDTQTSPRSYEAAVHAAGGCLEAVDRIVTNRLHNAFALIRPPGHHAERSRAMGFCLFNNVAVAARYAQAAHGLQRIMIVDWDLHHGNGTQRAFYDDPTVLYASTHQYPYYPGTGGFSETGSGEGEGYTLNVPLSPGHGDPEFVGIYSRIFVAAGRAFQPQLLIISAGFDIYEGDPLGGMAVTPKGFAMLTRILLNLAQEVCDGRVLVALEGGYDLKGLREAGKAVLLELIEPSVSADELNRTEAQGRSRVDLLVKRFHEAHGDRWKDVVL